VFLLFSQAMQPCLAVWGIPEDPIRLQVYRKHHKYAIEKIGFV